jgi:hypothetical protein
MYQQMMMMQQQMMQLGAMVDQSRGGSEITQGLANQFGIQMPQMSGGASAQKSEALGGESGVGEPSITKKARQRVAESTSPT